MNEPKPEDQVEHPLRQQPKSNNIMKNNSFIYEKQIYLLGVHFLENERFGFEDKIQKLMCTLMQQANKLDSEQASSSILNDLVLQHLPLVQFSIPNSLCENVQMTIIEADKGKFESLLERTKSNNKIISEEIISGLIDNLLISLTLKNVPVNQLFLYRGHLNSPVERCLTLTTVFSNEISINGDSNLPVQRCQQCFVLLADSPAQITEILDVFRKLHGINKYTLAKTPSPVMPRISEYKVVMNADVEILEEYAEGKWQSCPREKESFKLRTNLDKKICVTLHQDMTHFNFPVIKVERCFGMLLSPGRNIFSSDMVAIGHNSMSSSSITGTSNLIQQWQIVALWIPSELNFEYLNTETPRDNRIYFTIALDLVIKDIEEPVRFIFEAKAKIAPPPNSMAASATEKFWQNFTSKSAKQMQEHFNIIIRQKSANSSESNSKYEVVSCLSSTQITHQKQRLNLQLNRNSIDEGKLSPSVETPSITEEEDDEPLPSGTGLVTKECSQIELKGWKDIIDKWNSNLDVRPKQLFVLVRQGVPQALRPEVWQLLSGSNQVEEQLMKKYKSLVSKDSSFEAIIQRDIYRTFPAHEKFRESGSTEQESLFRICKAYSNFDEEIGYCQGLSFLVAALLLHMPEEQAFCVFVRIMYNYGLRDLYKSGLEELHCKFYQLERLIDEHMPELYIHFVDLNIESHMYASQWFLTLFTTKFPLNVVFLIIDLFLLDKMDTLLKIALALLKMSKNNLLALDFEGIMKYFRISLPKKYRNDDSSRELIRTAIKFNVKKAKKYEKEYRTWLESNRNRLNPLESLEKENKRLMTTAMRLEQENDDLSYELLTTCNSKIKLRDDLDRAEDKAETLNSLLLHTRTQLVDVEEEKAHLQEEVKNLKGMCRKEIERFEAEIEKNKKIIEEYKQICKNYQNKFELEKEQASSQINQIAEKVKNCESCSKAISEIMNDTNNCEISEQSALSQHGITDSSKVANKDSSLQKVLDLENELIKTKVALAESEDRNGQLVGKLHFINSELNILRAQNDESSHQRSNTWLTKTLSTIRDATKVKASHSITSGISSAGNSQDGPSSLSEAVGHDLNKVRRSNSRDVYCE